MKKILFFLTAVLSILLLFYLIGFKNVLNNIKSDKQYVIKNRETINITGLNNIKYFNKYIITYNEKKIYFLDYNGNIVYERENLVFSDKLFVLDEFILRSIKDSVEIIDLQNKSFIITEIYGEVIDVSRENDKIYIVTKQKNGQSIRDILYIIDENMDVAVKDKHFNNRITSVSMSDKSEAYCITTLNTGNNNLSNTIYLNLLDDIELWSVEINDEIIIDTKIINNNIIAIGTKNLYYYNLNGKLIWKIKNYNKITYYETSKELKKIIILQNDGKELISYDFESKINELNKTPIYFKGFKVIDNRIYLYDDNIIYLLEDNNFHELFEIRSEKIIDFQVKNNNIYILFANKLIKGIID